MLMLRDLVNPRGIQSPQYHGANYRAMFNSSATSDLLALTQNILESLPNEQTIIPARVGIEIEAENAYHSLMDWPIPYTWGCKEDGSLREGGLEFITPAIDPQDIRFAIASLFATLKWRGTHPNFSARTSVHIHMECLSMSVEQFKSFLLLYMVFEPSLFQMASPSRRETNIFCTPLTRANFYGLYNFFAARSGPAHASGLKEIAGSIHKYAALNFQHIFDFGTLEFRHIRGTGDTTFLIEWFELLLRLYRASLDIEYGKLCEEMMKLNTTSRYSNLADRVFGSLAPKMYGALHSKFMSRGVSLAKEILAGQDFAKRIVPSKKSGLHLFKRALAEREKNDALLNKKPYVGNWRPTSWWQSKAVWVHLPTLSEVGGAAVEALRECSDSNFKSHVRVLWGKYGAHLPSTVSPPKRDPMEALKKGKEVKQAHYIDPMTFFAEQQTYAVSADPAAVATALTDESMEQMVNSILFVHNH